jgi:hypothetical protein
VSGASHGHGFGWQLTEHDAVAIRHPPEFTDGPLVGDERDRAGGLGFGREVCTDAVESKPEEVGLRGFVQNPRTDAKARYSVRRDVRRDVKAAAAISSMVIDCSRWA